MTWKRGQVVLALWNLTAGESDVGAWELRDVPQAFIRRVVKLIDFGVGVGSHDKGGQRGVDHTYDLAGVMELALGLELMMFSWPQAEVASFIKHQRSELRGQMETSSEVDRLRIWIRPRSYAEGKSEGLLYYPPVFTRNKKSELQMMEKLDFLIRGYLVIDIGRSRAAIEYYLAKIPVTRRGRIN